MVYFLVAQSFGKARTQLFVDEGFAVVSLQYFADLFDSLARNQQVVILQVVLLVQLLQVKEQFGCFGARENFAVLQPYIFNSDIGPVSCKIDFDGRSLVRFARCDL